jgi:retron-type reverse transcriptase
LETDLGFPLKTLYSISNNIKKHYKTVFVPKRDGGARKLSVPDDILKKVQRSIAENILAYEQVSEYATAYKYGAAVHKNARVHVGSKKLLKLDILHFFDSIYYTTVKEKVFGEERFSEPLRVLLTMLCYYKDVLPQGAPTSPIITNIVMRDFDEKVGKWCGERNIVYTRYCDDMTFSGDFDEKEVRHFVKNELLSLGFVLNDKKTVSVNKNERMMVTGVVVNQKINAPAEYKRAIRQEVYYCKKFGVGEHIKRLGLENKEEYLRSLLGRIAFVLQITPNNSEFKDYKSFVKEALKNK